ncbi:MAG: hypothetical protein RIQ51_1126 [Bacteroidota bacterium]|jgi:hypothetical protein
MKKIIKWDLVATWDDGEEQSVATDLPQGTIMEIEQFLDYLEEEEND